MCEGVLRAVSLHLRAILGTFRAERRFRANSSTFRAVSFYFHAISGAFRAGVRFTCDFGGFSCGSSFYVRFWGLFVRKGVLREILTKLRTRACSFPQRIQHNYFPHKSKLAYASPTLPQKKEPKSTPKVLLDSQSIIDFSLQPFARLYK